MNRHEHRIRGERIGVRDPDRTDTGIVLENVRLTARVARLEADLLECLAFLNDNCDVVDGDYGEPAPNKEMQLAMMIKSTLYGEGNF